MERDERPWGGYEVLHESDGMKVKRIWVLPGKRLSLQRHKHRSEHWFIVSGFGGVVRGEHLDELIDCSADPGDSFDIKAGEIHRAYCRDTSSVPMVFIEVQRGAYLEEDDIERLEDDFGRS